MVIFLSMLGYFIMGCLVGGALVTDRNSLHDVASAMFLGLVWPGVLFVASAMWLVGCTNYVLKDVLKWL